MSFSSIQINEYINKSHYIGDMINLFYYILPDHLFISHSFRSKSQKFKSIYATFRPVERIFSYSGYINTPHRSRLTARNLEATTLLTCGLKNKSEN
ncbi:hypothetical protein BpHYR1_045185 [Brachionus plicatilis]|uniref:HAT C-terminal dimerisation domain-containing protein n=1 Tax=Brachionus plicatilis TaxID=10195 RepID=A0A3M7SCD0_BRAPC|nr:hypothetical protein BpHYR1_045185 [Brachionus plicatilis]